jgi:hypothetical protein
MLTIVESKAYIKSLYYPYNFSINLKAFQNKVYFIFIFINIYVIYKLSIKYINLINFHSRLLLLT